MNKAKKVLLTVVSVILALVSNRMSHQQLSERFGAVPFIPSEWGWSILSGVSQADTYAIGLTLLIFVLSMNFFKWFYALCFHGTQAQKKVSGALPNLVTSLLVTVIIGGVLAAAIQFSWNQTIFIAKKGRSAFDGIALKDHPAVIAAQTAESKAQSLYDKAAAAAEKSDEYEQKRRTLEYNGVYYRDRGDVALFESYKQQAATYSKLIATLAENRMQAERTLANRQARTVAVMDSIAQIGVVERVTTDNRVGPILELGIIALALLLFMAAGDVLPLASYQFKADSKPAQTTKTEQQTEMLYPQENNGSQAVRTNEDILQELREKGFGIKEPEISPFEIVDDNNLQNQIIKAWLHEQFDKGEKPDSGVQAVIRKFTGKVKGTVHNMVHSEFSKWQASSTDEGLVSKYSSTDEGSNGTEPDVESNPFGDSASQSGNSGRIVQFPRASNGQ